MRCKVNTVCRGKNAEYLYSTCAGIPWFANIIQGVPQGAWKKYRLDYTPVPCCQECRDEIERRIK